MPTLWLLVKVGLYALMGVSVIAAIGVVTLRNLFHSALSLVVVLIGIAGIFVALQAEFLAMAQILIYVGAVMTLVIFAIMMTHRIGDPMVHQNNHQSFAAALAVLTFIAALSRLIVKTPWPIQEGMASIQVTTMDLAKALLGPYVFPFEVISVVLIAAMVGAIVVAKKEKETS
jgi:NADH-quinone oxidoreductase subunit J